MANAFLVRFDSDPSVVTRAAVINALTDPANFDRTASRDASQDRRGTNRSGNPRKYWADGADDDSQCRGFSFASFAKWVQSTETLHRTLAKIADAIGAQVAHWKHEPLVDSFTRRGPKTPRPYPKSNPWSKERFDEVSYKQLQGEQRPLPVIQAPEIATATAVEELDKRMPAVPPPPPPNPAKRRKKESKSVKRVRCLAVKIDSPNFRFKAPDGALVAIRVHCAKEATAKNLPKPQIDSSTFRKAPKTTLFSKSFALYELLREVSKAQTPPGNVVVQVPRDFWTEDGLPKRMITLQDIDDLSYQPNHGRTATQPLGGCFTKMDETLNHLARFVLVHAPKQEGDKSSSTRFMTHFLNIVSSKQYDGDVLNWRCIATCSLSQAVLRKTIPLFRSIADREYSWSMSTKINSLVSSYQQWYNDGIGGPSVNWNDPKYNKFQYLNVFGSSILRKNGVAESTCQAMYETYPMVVDKSSNLLIAIPTTHAALSPNLGKSYAAAFAPRVKSLSICEVDTLMTTEVADQPNLVIICKGIPTWQLFRLIRKLKSSLFEMVVLVDCAHAASSNARDGGWCNLLSGLPMMRNGLGMQNSQTLTVERLMACFEQTGDTLPSDCTLQWSAANAYDLLETHPPVVPGDYVVARGVRSCTNPELRLHFMLMKVKTVRKHSFHDCVVELVPHTHTEKSPSAINEEAYNPDFPEPVEFAIALSKPQSQIHGYPPSTFPLKGSQPSMLPMARTGGRCCLSRAGCDNKIFFQEAVLAAIRASKIIAITSADYQSLLDIARGQIQ